MKTFNSVFIAMLFLVFTGLSCKKSGSQKNNAVQAVITGYDMRACVCCGGLMINFEGRTTPVVSPDYYQVKNDPASLGISATTVFPVYVDVTWVLEAQPGCGSKGFVRITSIVIH